MTLPRISGSTARARWSLERRLPLLLMVLLGTVIGGLGLAAYREVKAANMASAAEHLERAVRELSISSSRTSAARLVALHALAADQRVIDAIAAATPASAGSLQKVLDTSRSPSDSAQVGWEVWTAQGPILRSAGSLSPRDSVELAKLRDAIVQGDSAARSPLFPSGQGIHFWTALPVRSQGHLIAILAEQRRVIGSPQAEKTVQELIGTGVQLLFASEGAEEWATVRGTAMQAPFAMPAMDGKIATVIGGDGKRYQAVQSRVPGTPWHMVLFQSESSVTGRARDFLRKVLMTGFVLLVFGTLGAWVVSRHVTKPLQRITSAAAALAGGDFSQRVAVEGEAELASLAQTFNAMATALGKAQAQLAERNEELNRANDAKVRFLAVMSHELRTPLNAIGGYAELMELGVRGPITQAQAEDLARIRRSKDHLLSIIRDILAFSRADAGHLTLNLQDVPLAKVMSDAVDAIGPQFAGKGVRLEVAPVPGSHVVRGDREKVQQIVLNLLSNALRFTKAEGAVVVTSHLEPDRVRIDVRDTGIGIAPDRLRDIFDPFVQVDASLTRETGGTGLGLAISRDLATAMGGSVTVESRVGEGSTFTLTLPRAGSPPATLRAGEPKAIGSGS